MVTFDHFGRMGNFLFQAAAAIGYAKRNSMDFTVPTTTNDPKWNPLYLQHLANPEFNPGLPEKLIAEREHSYNDLPMGTVAPSKNVRLRGYFQTEKYFSEFRDEIIRLFGYPYQPEKGVVGIHVRRGDYVTLPYKHPICTPEFFYQALRVFTKDDIVRFRVFSDDIAWCKEFFQPKMPYENIPLVCVFEFSEGKSEVEDLVEMSWCEHQIISNGTFGWWAAWLNQNPNKIVVSPHEDNWFGRDNKMLDVKDVIPESWGRIKYTPIYELS